MSSLIEIISLVLTIGGVLLLAHVCLLLVRTSKVKYLGHDRFWWCNTGQLHFLPYIHITQESINSIRSVGTELGWITRWTAIQWNFSTKNSCEFITDEETDKALMAGDECENPSFVYPVECICSDVPCGMCQEKGGSHE